MRRFDCYSNIWYQSCWSCITCSSERPWFSVFAAGIWKCTAWRTGWRMTFAWWAFDSARVLAKPTLGLSTNVSEAAAIITGPVSFGSVRMSVKRPRLSPALLVLKTFWSFFLNLFSTGIIRHPSDACHWQTEWIISTRKSQKFIMRTDRWFVRIKDSCKAQSSHDVSPRRKITFRRPIYQPDFSPAARSNSVCIRAVYSSYFRKAQNIVSMIPHIMKKNANCTSSVITTNCFQFGGLLKTVLLLGFLSEGT